MTTQQIAPPAPSRAPYAAAWSLHLYDGRAFLTFDGRVQVTATCSTPAQETRLIALLDRLTTRTSQRHC